MAQKYQPSAGSCDWTRAKGLIPFGQPNEVGLQGVLVPDQKHDWDHIAVVYDKGNTPPEITVKAVSGFVHTVFADGMPVAVVARSEGPAPSPVDVLLVERGVGS